MTTTNQPPQTINTNNVESTQLGGQTTIFTPLLNGISYLNHKVMYLNNSKFFAVLL